MSIIITGVAGFIGHSLAKALMDIGEDIVGIDNIAGSYSKELKWARISDMRCDKLHMEYTDICTGRIDSIFRDYRPSAVYHFAGEAGVRESIDDPLLYVHSNIMGTVNLLEACQKYGVDNFIFASSAGIYGEGGSPDSQYGVSKLCGEAFGEVYSKLYGMGVINLRFFSVYGPWGRPDMAIMNFIHRIYNDIPITVFGDGTQTRSFIYIDDIVRGNILARYTIPGCYDLGTNVNTSVNELVDIVAGIVGHTPKVTYEPRHPADILVGSTPGTGVPGWGDHTALVNGIDNTYRWYMGNIELMNEVMGG